MTPLQIFAQESLKVLTDKQKEVWLLQREMSQEEIAITLGISQQAVQKHIKAAEKRIIKFGKTFRSVFNTMIDAMPKEEQEELDGAWQVRAWESKKPVRKHEYED